MDELTEKTRSTSDNLIIIGIYISIFINSYVFFTQPFEFYIGYLIYLILLPVFVVRYGINQNLVNVFSVLLLTGIWNIFAGNNTVALFSKVFTGLVLAYFFYDYVIKEFNFDLEQLFKWYLTGAFIVSMLGLFQFISFQIGFEQGFTFFGIFNKWGVVPGGMFGIRVNSVFAEPTYLASTLSAAFFVALYNLLQKERFHLNLFQSIVIVLVFLLSFSGLGQVGIMISLILLAINFGLVRYIFIFLPLGVIVFSFMYNNVEEFRGRYDSLISLYLTGKFELGKTHGSSFILYNNAHVAVENFKSNFVFGGGIGSHPVAFDKFSMANGWKVTGFNQNSADANSMLLRLISETGMFGTFIFLFITFRGYVPRGENLTNHWLISNAILVMLLVNLFRQGHYFLNGFPFFVLIYVYNYLDYRNRFKSVETS